MRTIRTGDFDNGFGEKRQIDPKRELRVKVCPKWAPPLSKQAAENFDRIFGEREPGEAGQVLSKAAAEKSLAAVNYRDNFDAIFGKPPADPFASVPLIATDEKYSPPEPADFDDAPRAKR